MGQKWLSGNFKKIVNRLFEKRRDVTEAILVRLNLGVALKVVRLSIVVMAAGLALGLGFLNPALGSGPARPVTQAPFQLIFPVIKTVTQTSVYTVTNVSSATATTQHDFSTHGGIVYSFSDTLAVSGTKVYILDGIPQVPLGFNGNVIITSDQPITGSVTPLISGTIPLLPAVYLTKSASAVVITAAQVVTYRYEVGNIGTAVLSDVVVSDDQLGLIGNTGPLTPGQTVMLIQPGLVATQTTNVATASATSAYGPASAYASATVSFVALSQTCTPTIQSAADGNWHDPATWNPERLPTSSDIVQIQANHTITGPATPAYIGALCNEGVLQSQLNQPLQIVATGLLTNAGHILGRPGSVGTGAACGGPGSSIELRGSPVYNGGVIQAGRGGDGQRCGGPGGSTMILGRDTFNAGDICAGPGGNVLGTASGPGGGQGGDTHIWGKSGGPGYLYNTGLACAGHGGNGHPNANGPQPGGRGGTLKLISLPSVFLSGGEHTAGQGGQGSGGGADGPAGWVIIEPNVISLAGPETRVSGGNIVIFGGNDWVLDLSNMAGAAISATENITLAVGSGGAVDLQGNTGPVLQAGGQVMIASDVISLEAGIALTDVAGPHVTAGPSQILGDVSLLGPGQVPGQPGVTLPISLTLLNSGPLPDTYTLSRFDSAGWSLGALPPTLTVAGLELSDLLLTVTPPVTAPAGQVNVITVTATSQTDPQLVAVAQVEIAVKRTGVYLPLILKSGAK